MFDAVKQFFAGQYNDVKGNAKWALLVILWAPIVTALKYLLQQMSHVPIWGVWLILVFVSLVAFVWVAKSQRSGQQQQPFAQSTAMTPMPAAINFDAATHFRTAHYSQLTTEAEKNIRLAAAQNQPNDREGFLAKLIGIGIVSYLHDMTWAYIYKSQILMLTELNRRGGIMAIADVKAFFDKAKEDYPNVYKTYEFEGWLRYLEKEQLIIHHPSEMMEITLRGRDFLKYLTHWGRTAETRSG
jgi:hypothetical protein